MKKIALMVCLLVLAGKEANAQSWLEKMGNRVKENVVQKGEQRIEDKTDEATDKVLDKSEDAVKRSGKKGKKQHNQLLPRTQAAEFHPHSKKRMFLMQNMILCLVTKLFLKTTSEANKKVNFRVNGI